VNDLAELKRFVVAHAISQNLPPDHYSAILDAITSDDQWAREWIRAGERAADPLVASQFYTMGRFPFVDGPGRAEALDRAVDSFDRWRRNGTGIESETVDVDGTPVRIWTVGLSADEPRPLLVVTGGIVSTKEQWGPVLPQIAQFGMAGVVAELPGVGQNALPYRADSWRLFPAILDALADRANVADTYLLALSFSGHLAITAALHDSRIRGIVGNGTPVREFFTDPDWQARVPKVTTDTLAHLVGVPSDEVYQHVQDWGLTERQLSAVEIPLAVVWATQDEIIPQRDVALLRDHVANLTVLEHDDVHGAPSHLAETRLWSLLAVLEMRANVDETIRAGIANALAAVRAGAST
jgi:pimeloyl-ACP methyl ester carboxylesterase